MGIGEAVADLPAADLAELVNELTLQEAAAVLAMLPLSRAVEVLDQPTLRRRGAIVDKLEPGAIGPILEGLASDQRVEISAHRCTRSRGGAASPSSARDAGRGRAPAALSRAHGGRAS